MDIGVLIGDSDNILAVLVDIDGEGGCFGNEDFDGKFDGF